MDCRVSRFDERDGPCDSRAATQVANTLHVGDASYGSSEVPLSHSPLQSRLCLLANLNRLFYAPAKMADASGHPNFIPKINPDDHSANVVLCGALILPPVTMMTILSIYNRVRSKTLVQVDSLVNLIGIVYYVIATFHHVYIKLTV